MVCAARWWKVGQAACFAGAVAVDVLFALLAISMTNMV
jgi:hypothetical protein